MKKLKVKSGVLSVQHSAVSFLFSVQQLVREGGGVQQVSRLHVQCIGNIVQNFQRERPHDVGRFNRTQVRTANVRFLRQFLLGKSLHFSHSSDGQTKLHETVTIFKTYFFAHIFIYNSFSTVRKTFIIIIVFLEMKRVLVEKQLTNILSNYIIVM